MSAKLNRRAVLALVLATIVLWLGVFFAAGLAVSVFDRPPFCPTEDSCTVEYDPIGRTYIVTEVAE